MKTFCGGITFIVPIRTNPAPHPNPSQLSSQTLGAPAEASGDIGAGRWNRTSNSTSEGRCVPRLR